MTAQSTRPDDARIPRLALTVNEAASCIGVSRAKLYQRIKEGHLVSFLSCGRRLVRPEALQAMLDRDETQTVR
jgi:excisionase family DNA binding protein